MTTETLDARGLTREELLDLVRESGVLEELKDELRADAPMNAFANSDEGADSLQAGMGSGGFPWQYWRKKDGRIITGPEPRETLYRTYERKGYRPLPEYGLLPTPGSPVPCCRNKFMRTEQFHVLLARGGAKEFPIEQIIAAGWHLKPPVIHGKVIKFPQLKGVVIEQADCDECDKPFYGVAGSRSVVQAMRQHCNARHGFNRREVDEMLYRIGYLQETPKTVPGPRQRGKKVEATVEDTDDDD